MKNIFNRKEFLKEWLSASDEHRDFMYDEIKNYISIFKKTELENNQSFMNGAYYRADYETDIKELNAYLIKSFNYNLDIFFDEYNKEIYSDDFFTQTCGFLDTLLYTYDQKYPLGGFFLEKNTGNDEVVIKYDYGYQNYDLGKKYLLQNFDTLEDFYFECASKFFTYYNEVSGFKHFKDIEKNLNMFSMVDRKEKGSLCIFDPRKFYSLYKNSLSEKSYDESSAIYYIEKSLENLNHKYFEVYGGPYKGTIMIVGFGDIDLNDIDDQEIYEYDDQIDLQSMVKKYNVF